MLAFNRRGRYVRVFKPGWTDPLDTSFSKVRGGRWTPPGEFGAVYLCANIEVAAANARAQHRGRAIGLFDVRPEKRPALLDVLVPRSTVADLVTGAGLLAAGLPANFPFGVRHSTCWPPARTAYEDSANAGIASRSGAEATQTHWLGEELAWFDRSPRLLTGPRREFAAWYPDPHP